MDPGKSGGVARLGFSGNVEVWEMPDDLRMLADLWTADKNLGEGLHVFLEKGQAFPGQGRSSCFNYGVHHGELRGLLTGLRIPHTLVPPARWAKVIHAGCAAGEAKERSLEACRRLFPDVCLTLGKRKKPHDGLVDALLIAEYGRRALVGAA